MLDWIEASVRRVEATGAQPFALGPRRNTDGWFGTGKHARQFTILPLDFCFEKKKRGGGSKA